MMSVFGGKEVKTCSWGCGILQIEMDFGGIFAANRPVTAYLHVTNDIIHEIWGVGNPRVPSSASPFIKIC